MKMSNSLRCQIDELISDSNIIHFPASLSYKRFNQIAGEYEKNQTDLSQIYHLTESHVPGLRMKTISLYDKYLNSGSVTKNMPLEKNNVAFPCISTKVQKRINSTFKKLEELPKEWTLVQLTPQFNSAECAEISLDATHMNPIYLTVFYCGKSQPKPFCVKAEPPRDKINGRLIDLHKELRSIMAENKAVLTNSEKRSTFKNPPEKFKYYRTRTETDDRLKSVVKSLEKSYLKHWRCLLIGKYLDSKIEKLIQQQLIAFFKNERYPLKLSKKQLCILSQLVKGAGCLKVLELKAALLEVFNEKTSTPFLKSLGSYIRQLFDKMVLSNKPTQPVILIVDDSLDCFPWEMLDVLNNAPVSRMPSFHLVYALFEEHKATIKDGYKIIENPEKGSFILNPSLDLTKMENRLSSFYSYWVPTWRGLTRISPTQNQFEEMATHGEIFAYNGHGNGTQYFSLQKIERVRIEAVALLFGCSSVKLYCLGPQTEMITFYYMYLMACSPCVVGMLWEVTDVDTDVLTTDFMSRWIPNPSKSHWRTLDKSKWRKGEKVDFVDTGAGGEDEKYYEPDLLKALSQSKKSDQLTYYQNKSACVARGIPVKIRC